MFIILLAKKNKHSYTHLDAIQDRWLYLQFMFCSSLHKHVSTDRQTSGCLNPILCCCLVIQVQLASSLQEIWLLRVWLPINSISCRQWFINTICYRNSCDRFAAAELIASLVPRLHSNMVWEWDKSLCNMSLIPRSCWAPVIDWKTVRN